MPPTFSTRLWEHNPAAAQLVLGHTTDRTTMRHYIAAPGIIARACAGLSQPAAFLRSTPSPAASIPADTAAESEPAAPPETAIADRPSPLPTMQIHNAGFGDEADGS